MKYKKVILLFVLNAMVGNKCASQSYYATSVDMGLYRIDIDEFACGGCTFNFISPLSTTYNGLNFCPDTTLVGLPAPFYLFEIDTTTGSETQIFTPPAGNTEIGSSLLSVGGGIFYTIKAFDDDLYRININAGTVTLLGSTGHAGIGDLALFNGNIYYSGTEGIVLLDTTNLNNSSIIATYPSGYFVVGLTASHICNSLLGIGGIPNTITQIVLINIIDGAFTFICDIPNEFWSIFYITSMLEFTDLTDCDITLDLDCNDSSGASGSDFNSPEFDCLSDGVDIADEDIGMLYDAYIETMTIEITGFIPDAPNEILEMTGSIPGIDATGIGTDVITLTNEGVAKSTDFKDVLRLIQYNNTALLPTAGLRTVEVQFTTESGSQSNIATAFIEVIELPLVDVDLGADQQACDGESVTFDAGHPGADFVWSSGDNTQTITVDASGEYIVTVSDGVNCPGRDTVELDILPVISVSLTGDTEICDNEPANLLINTDTPFPLSIEISADPGNPFSFSDVTGNFPFIDLPTESTNYTITTVTASQDACITITDPEQFIDVYPSYIQAVDVALCDGDSIWLGFYWETEAGVYENEFNSIYGCDSVVTTTISILPAINITQQYTTCDSAAAGVFITYLDNPSGCDTVVTTTVSLLPSDTTQINLLSCVQADVGSTSQTLINQNGCDSLVITITGYSPPTDTTLLFVITCDSSLLGISQNIETNQAGCDSLVITNTSIAPSDTTYLNGASCDTSSIGVSQTLYNNTMGCDSLVITTIVAGVPDTTHLSMTSCDSSSLGVWQYATTGADGCDSLVITTVTYSAQDSTFIMSASCDPSDVGVFVQMLINSFGCDSIVTETISLLPSNATNINSSTCDPAEVGIFTNTLINQYGCDSIVTETITLLPSDATFLTGTTCKSSEAGMFITTHLNQYGCDSIVTLTVSLIPSDTTIVSFKTCDPSQVGSIENLYVGNDGCDSLVIETTSLFPLPQLNLVITSDFNGYGISCFGEHDGSIEATTTGEDPFQYSWSTGDTTQSITGLGAGDYDVLITDANGCMASGSIALNQPEAFSIDFEVSQPDCFTNEDGTITVLQSGGVLPVRYSKDGTTYQSSPTFSNLSAGSYTITALDANDCEAKEIIMINVSIDINVDLGDDQIIMPGDTSTIEALVNVPYDSLASITWIGLMNPNCPTCLTQFVAPIITTAYTVSVSNAQGCSDLDSMIVFVQRNIDIYVPNLFSPNDDGINDRLLISAGADVEEIESFTIFDRWGNMIYLNEHFLPNDPGEAWDGKRKGVTLNPGVYAFRMIAHFSDGRSEVRYGDITLMR